MTSTTELHRMTMTELRRELLVKRVEYAKMRLGIEMQKEKNHARFKTMRKEIARMSTILTGMQKGQEEQRGQKATPLDKKTSVTSVTSVPSVPSEKASQVVKKSVKSPRSKAKKS